MMTPQDIREKTFEKAIFGGYDANAVDEFLENAAADLSALSKENAMLKSKMKILVNKIEEYRSTEDAMRLALLSAQKFGAQLQNEAKENSEALLNEARAAATALVKNAKNEVYEEEMRLLQAKRASAQFIENMRMLCTKQLDFLALSGNEDGLKL
jgi:cell division initiation protein